MGVRNGRMSKSDYQAVSENRRELQNVSMSQCIDLKEIIIPTLIEFMWPISYLKFEISKVSKE